MVLSMNRFVGKVAVVTGASSGIGAAIVEKLVENGLIVAGVARRAEIIEECAKKYAGKKGKLVAVKADMSKEDDILRAFKWIEGNLGPIHVLVNNAGYATMGGLTDGKTEEWRKTLDLNIISLCVATREAVRLMRANKVNGHIIHINSIFGHQVTTHTWNIYPASKYAVTALTETLRQELNALGCKIKITSVSPGLVATEMTTKNKNASADTKAFLAKLPILQPEDIADGICYALSTPEHVQVHELTIQPL
ncbi:farnesol dehydrogenase-like [Tribolium madens]|uniref:farnesol dehydrogenase-like n=1 Tax=Tribolium madens TaxID=41895 RepID=UPI001CF726F0|nr:farnesol dehydrogenase-like [Tribolium madens]